VNNCAADSSSVDFNIRSVDQKILRDLLKAFCHVHKACNETLSKFKRIQSITTLSTHFIPILTLSFHLKLVFRNDIFRSGFATRIFYTNLICPMRWWYW